MSTGRERDYNEIQRLGREVSELTAQRDALLKACKAAAEAMHRMATRLGDVGHYGLPEDLNGFYNGTGQDGENVRAFQLLETAIREANQ